MAEQSITLLTQMRNARGLSLKQLAEKIGTNQSNLSRIERGQQLPSRKIARALFSFYDGSIPLATVYDPTFPAELTQDKP